MAERSLEDYTAPELIAAHREALKKNALFDTLLSSPDTRADALALVRKKNPNLPIPELDAKAASDAALAEERKAREKVEGEVRELSAYIRLKEERERVMEENGLSKDQLKEVEKLMTDETAPIPNFNGAVKVFKASQVQATPTSSLLSVKTFDMPEKTTWGKGVGNKMALDKVFKEAAYEAVNLVRSGKTA